MIPEARSYLSPTAMTNQLSGASGGIMLHQISRDVSASGSRLQILPGRAITPRIFTFSYACLFHQRPQVIRREAKRIQTALAMTPEPLFFNLPGHPQVPSHDADQALPARLQHRDQIPHRRQPLSVGWNMLDGFDGVHGIKRAKRWRKAA